MFLREQSWRNSFAMKWGGKSAYFLSQSSRRIGEMIAFLRALRNIGDSSLLYASFRMTWFYFYSRLGIWIIFETQRFFIIPMFLRKQSRNSLANWWSVCFKMFFPNVVICGMASTGSATVYENYFYAQPPCMKIIFILFCFIFWSVKVLFFHYFFKYAKLAKFIRYEALWK